MILTLIGLFKRLSLRTLLEVILVTALLGASWTAYVRGERVVSLESKLSLEQSKSSRLSTLLTEQSDAVRKLTESSKRYSEMAQVALDGAKKKASKDEDRAAAALKRPPKGKDDCSSSEDLINEAIRNLPKDSL